MKKILFILIAMICLFTCGCVSEENKTTIEQIKEKDVLTVGVKTDVKPFGYIENGEHKGFDIDIAKKIARNLLGDSEKIEFVEVTSENRISKLITGEIDIIIATMTDTPERRAIIDFSYPYYISGQAILCKKQSDVVSIADLSNHNIVIVNGTTAEKTLQKYYKRSNVIKKTNYKEAFANVNANTCMIADEAILRGFSFDNQNYMIFNKKLSAEPYAVAVRKSDIYLKNYIDNIIKRLEKTGELKEIAEKWIK